MKKEYQKPVVAGTDMKKGKTFTNSKEYEEKILHQEWMRQAEEQGIVEYAKGFKDHADQQRNDTFDMDEKFCVNPEFIYREIAGESLLIPNGEMARQFNGLASLNKTGAFLWKLLEQERSLQELSKMFAKEYELTEEESIEDVTAFLKLALTKDLIIRN